MILQLLKKDCMIAKNYVAAVVLIGVGLPVLFEVLLTSALFEIVRELQQLLEYKRDFARSLTPSQIEAFWHPADEKAH